MQSTTVKLDRNSSCPLWEQLEEIIRNQIDDGFWKPGEAILSENILSKTYGLSRMTVRSVITRLVHEGLLYRVPGKGTFVSEPKIVTTPLAYIGVRGQLEKKGYEITTEVTRNEMVVITERVAKKLNVEPNSRVYMVERIRLIKGKPLSIHRSYIKFDTDPKISNNQLEQEQLCNILRDSYKIIPTKVEETLELSYSSEKYTSKLGVSESHPLLYLQDINYMNEEVVEYSEVYFRGDQVKLSFEYKGDLKN